MKKTNYYPLVTLCGSTKFKNEFIEIYEGLHRNGIMVFLPACFSHADGQYNNGSTNQKMKAMYDNMHFEKELLSDAVVIVNKDGYIGQSTQTEIEFAKVHNIPVINAFISLSGDSWELKSFDELSKQINE